jgi:hypothetical protein
VPAEECAAPAHEQWVERKEHDVVVLEDARSRVPGVAMEW